jgi:HK97 family phage major capsid protein
MSEDVKTVVNEVAQAFDEFKKVNDERLDNIEKGLSTADTDSKLDKIEAKLQSLEDVKSEIEAKDESNAKLEERLISVEKMVSRPEAGLDAPQVDTVVKAFDAWCRKGDKALTDPEIVKALTVSNDATGGYLAPPEYVREMIKDITEISPIRSIARVRNTSSKSVQFPKKVGTFAAQWVGETGTRSETTGYQVGLEEIPAHEHYAEVHISEANLEDSVFNLEAEMQSEFAEQFAKAEGTAFVSGNSVNKPEGLLQNSSVSEVNSGSASALTADGLISLVHSIKSEYGRNGTFIFNRNTLAEIRKLKDTAGQYVFQAGMSLQAGVPNTILGYPYVEVTDMPAIAGNAFPVMFGDFRRAYLIIDRVALSVLRDPFTVANNGNVKYLARRRVGGQVVQAEAIVKQKIAS